jgi:L-amino acid N-acyltransferase YncA
MGEHFGTEAIQIEPATPAAWPALRAIYQEGIDTGDATFETRPPETWAAWSAAHAAGCHVLARRDGTVCGWAALTPVSGRCVYAGVAELSIYVGAVHRGRGVGDRLLRALIEVAEAREIWTVQAGVFPENVASLRLLARNGFRVVGRRERLGQMSHGPRAGAWRDVILLERRSRRVGT